MDDLEKKDLKRKGRGQGIALGVLSAIGAALIYNKATGKHLTDAITSSAKKTKDFVTKKVDDIKKKKAEKKDK